METRETCQIKDTQGDLSRSERIARAGGALVMLVYPMIASSAPLGLITLLPLIAIYPMYSAIVGWDPVRYVLSNLESQGISRAVARAGLAVIGTGLIAATMFTSLSPLGGLAVLALLGILPIFIAIFGENPLVALFESSQVRAEFDREIDQTQDEPAGRVVEYAPRGERKASQHDHLPTHHEAA